MKALSFAMQKKIASFFSWVFQPLLMPLYAAIIFVNLPYYAFMLMPQKLINFILTCNLVFTVMLPGFIILTMYRLKIISSITLENREDRKFPLLFTGFFYLANFYFLNRVALPAPYYLFLLAGLFSIVLILIITSFWKISVHMAGIGSICGAIILSGILFKMDVKPLVASLFIIAGIIGSARLILKVHTSGQVAWGFIAGFAPQLALIFFVPHALL